MLTRFHLSKKYPASYMYQVNTLYLAEIIKFPTSFFNSVLSVLNGQIRNFISNFRQKLVPCNYTAVHDRHMNVTSTLAS